MTLDKASQAFHWYRAVATALCFVLAYYYTYALWRSIHHAPSMDFVSYWAAGRLALAGNPADAYNDAVHYALERTVSTLNEGVQPFPYPPPFLLMVAPFALLDFPVGFGIWLIVTIGLFVWALWRIAPWPWIFCLPEAHMNALVGQNGFLTAAIFAAGTTLLETQPFLAGAILGVMIIKPQLALMLPVAVIASRNWKAIVGAIGSTSALLLVALAVFGPTTYAAFLAYLSGHSHTVSTGVPLHKLASVAAAMLFLGAPMALALAVQAVVALGAAIATWVAWSRDLPTKVPILAAATLLAPPYLFGYDALLLLIPLGWLIRHERQPWTVAAIFFLCLLPLAAGSPFYPGPNTIPLAAALAVWAMFREAREGAGEEAAPQLA